MTIEGLLEFSSELFQYSDQGYSSVARSTEVSNVDGPLLVLGWVTAREDQALCLFVGACGP